MSTNNKHNKQGKDGGKGSVWSRAFRQERIKATDLAEGASTPEMSKEQFADDNQKAGQGSPRQPPATSQRWLDIWRDQMS